MPVIEPTPGRVLWFYPASDDARLATLSEAPLAAIVAKVISDRMVNLMVVADDGHPVGRVSQTLVQDGDTVPQRPYATWMPYQRAVASGQIAPTLHAIEASLFTPEVRSIAMALKTLSPLMFVHQDHLTDCIICSDGELCFAITRSFILDHSQEEVLKSATEVWDRLVSIPPKDRAEIMSVAKLHAKSGTIERARKTAFDRD